MKTCFVLGHQLSKVRKGGNARRKIHHISDGGAGGASYSLGESSPVRIGINSQDTIIANFGQGHSQQCGDCRLPHSPFPGEDGDKTRSLLKRVRNSAVHRFALSDGPRISHIDEMEGNFVQEALPEPFGNFTVAS